MHGQVDLFCDKYVSSRALRISPENLRVLLANLFATTKLRFLQRRLQSLGAFKQAIGEATFQRIRVRQQYPNDC